MPSRKIHTLSLSIAAVLLLAFLAGAANPARGGNDSHILRLSLK
jgi:hypothetical protein